MHLEGELHFEIPEEHEPAVRALWDEMEGRRKVMRQAQEEWILARDALWEAIYKALGIDRNDPKFSKLLYKPEEKVVIKGGRTHSELACENDVLRDMNGTLQTTLDAKLALIREQRYEGATKAREIESVLRKFLTEFGDIDTLLTRFDGLSDRLNSLEEDNGK